MYFLHKIEHFCFTPCAVVLLFYLLIFIIGINEKKPNRAFVSFSQFCSGFTDQFISFLGNVGTSIFGLVMLSIICIFFFPMLLFSPTFQDIIDFHNIYFMSSGTHCFYGKLNNGESSQLVPLGVEIDYEPGGEGEAETWSYILKTADINGKRLIFEYSDSENLLIDEAVIVVDANSEKWSCTLINKGAYSPLISETSGYSFFNIFELLFKLVCFGFGFIFFYRLAMSSKKAQKTHLKFRRKVEQRKVEL